MSSPRWWAPVTLAEGQTGRWVVGPATLWIARRLHEWRLSWRYAEDGAEVGVEAMAPDAPPADAEAVAWGVSAGHGEVRLAPRLADRAVVVRPERPLRIASGTGVTLFVTTPVWARMELGAEPLPLQELPLSRAVDTWFGPSTMEGELCYAARAAPAPSLADVRRLPHRAITEVEVRNLAGEPLGLERLRLPVAELSLYAGEDGTLWTEALSLERHDAGDQAEVHVSSSPPAEAGAVERVCEPRAPRAAGAFARVFGSWLG